MQIMAEKMVLALSLALVAIALVFADQAFVGLTDNGSLVLNPPAGGQVLVDGVMFRSLVEQVGTLTRQLEAQAQQIAALQAEAKPPGLQVSGAGVAVVNGQYIHYGVSEGRPVYVKVQASGDLFVASDGAFVWIAYAATYSLSTMIGTNAITGSCSCGSFADCGGGPCCTSAAAAGACGGDGRCADPWPTPPAAASSAEASSAIPAPANTYAHVLHLRLSKPWH